MFLKIGACYSFHSLIYIVLFMVLISGTIWYSFKLFQLYRYNKFIETEDYVDMPLKLISEELASFVPVN